MFHKLGIYDTTLLINFLGSCESRNKYKSDLVSYLNTYHSSLDEDSQRRLSTNPLRILDSKNPVVIEICQQAPILMDYLSHSERERFDHICQMLSDCHIPYTIDHKLVRGLDYYNDLVFEFTSTHLGAQSAVSAGGRYDTFTQSISTHQIPAVGFSIGMERLVSMCQYNAKVKPVIQSICINPEQRSEVLHMLTDIRSRLPDWTVRYSHKETSLKSHLKKAAKDNVDLILIADNGSIQLKSRNLLDSDVITDCEHAPALIQQICEKSYARN